MKASRSCRFQASCCPRKTCSTAVGTSDLEFWAVTVNEQESRVTAIAIIAQFLRIQVPRNGNSLTRPLSLLFRGGEFDNVIFSRNRAFSGNRLMFVELVIGTRSEEREFFKDKRNAFGLQNRVPIRYLKMQVRTSCVAAISEPSQNIPTAYVIMDSNLDASRLQVRKRDIAVGGDTNDDVVSRDVIESDRLRQDAGCILRYSIHNLGYFSIRHGKNWLAIAPPIFVARGSVMRVPIRTNFDPVNGEPLWRIN